MRFFYIWRFFVLPVLYFIEIFIEIRIAFPHSDRIGDFNIYNYVLWHREFRGVKINAKPRQIFLLCPKYVANIQLFKMWRRVLPIYQVHALLFAGTYFFRRLKKNKIFLGVGGFGFEHEEFSHSEPLSLY